MNRRAAGTLLVALLVALAGPVRAADVAPAAATIRANVRASAHTPPAYRETIVITSSDGTTLIEHDLVRGDDVREIADNGPFHSESGTVGGKRWRQNENGLTLDDPDDPGLAPPEPLTTTVDRVARPFDAYVITTVNARGWGKKEYVDPTSWRLVRRETIGANGTIATAYDDVRDERGRVFAHHWHTDDAVKQTTSEARVTEYAPGDVGDGELARPPSRRTLVTFPDGVRGAELPVHFAEHPYVAVRIGGADREFILDSGASGIALDAPLANELGLKLYGEHSHVVAGRSTYARAIIPELRIGVLTMRDVTVAVVPLGWTQKRGVRIAGLLGFDFLAQLGVTIDYEHQRITAFPGSSYVPPSDPHTVALPARFGHGIPLVTAALDGAVAERLGVDTGGAGDFLIFDYFMRRHPNAFQDGESFSFGRMPKLTGVGGTFATAPAFVHRFELGGFRLADVLGNRVTSPQSYAQDVDGVIGAGLLRYFTLGLDYANERVYLTPNTEGRKALGL